MRTVSWVKERRTVDERRYFEYPKPRVYSKFRRPSLNDTGNMKPGVQQDRVLEFWLATRLCTVPATSCSTSVTPPVVKPVKFCARYFAPLRRGDNSNLPVSMNWGVVLVGMRVTIEPAELPVITSTLCLSRIEVESLDL
jgi:hypothetical protein